MNPRGRATAAARARMARTNARVQEQQSFAASHPADLTGRRFGLLRVTGPTFSGIPVSIVGSYVWNVVCQCGRESSSERRILTSGQRTNCNPKNHRQNK